MPPPNAAAPSPPGPPAPPPPATPPRPPWPPWPALRRRRPHSRKTLALGPCDRAAGDIEAAARRRGPRAARAAGRDLGQAGDLRRRAARAARAAQGQVVAERGILEDQRAIGQVDAAAAGRLAGAAVARRLRSCRRPRLPRRRRPWPRRPARRRASARPCRRRSAARRPAPRCRRGCPRSSRSPPRSPGPGIPPRCSTRSSPTTSKIRSCHGGRPRLDDRSSLHHPGRRCVSVLSAQARACSGSRSGRPRCR